MRNELLNGSAMNAARGMGTDMGYPRRGFEMPRMNYMSDTGPGWNTDARASHILSLLDAGEGDGAGSGAEAPAGEEQPGEGGDAESEVEAAEPEGEATDTAKEGEADKKAGQAPSGPSIEPPVSWKADAKDVFSKLPPALQKVVADRESERETNLTQRQQEFAENTRKLDGERETMRTELSNRQAQHTQILNSLLAAAVQISPALAEADRLSAGNPNPLEGQGWVELARTNPAEYLEKQAAAKYALGQLQGAMGQAINNHKQSISDGESKSNAQLAAFVAAEVGKLENHPELGPIWKDQTKRSEFQGQLKTFLNGKGFNDQEVQGITDSRVMDVARDAMLYRQLMADKSRIPAQRTQASPPGRVVRPGASVDRSAGGSEKMQKALKQTRGMKSDRDIADAIARAL